MAGLKQTVDSIYHQSLQVAYRPPGAALGIAAHNIFQLTGGPAYVKGFFAYCNVTMAAASTFQVSACGVVLENAAVVCNLVVGEMAVWPLAGGAGNVIIPNVSNTPYPPLATTLLGMTGGILLSPGSAAGDLFILTVGAVICPINTVSFYVIYYKMAPETLIVPL
jgi:hypothetical protein